MASRSRTSRSVHAGALLRSWDSITVTCANELCVVTCALHAGQTGNEIQTFEAFPVYLVSASELRALSRAEMLQVTVLSLCLQGFFCFAIVFCALIQTAFWRYTNNSEVEDAMMDVYDSVYEEVRRNLSSFRRQELATIHETVSCFQSWYIQVYGMILTSFLWFSIHFSNNLDRKGKYIFRET
uniref:Uncharacterized protein n=1 Tax=Chrysemys picta bellii TaxID=8478 RepID=A0A8C3FIY6_CHRPI